MQMKILYCHPFTAELIVLNIMLSVKESLVDAVFAQAFYSPSLTSVICRLCNSLALI